MNTFLIVSDTIYFIENTLKTLKKDIDNVITFNMEENTIDEILEEASYYSMFNEEKCVIVKNAKFFASFKKEETKKAKEEAEKLLKYLEQENKTTRLIFILNGKVDTKKKIYNLINENKNVYISSAMTKTDMKNTLNKIVVDNKYTIEDRSLWHIINNSLGNFDLAFNELNKIFTYYSKPGAIIYEDVVALTSKTMEENNFRLVDSIIAKNLELSLKYLEEAKILKVEPNIIISLIYREFKLMLSTLLYEENKYNTRDILSNLKLAEWQLNKIKTNLRNYKKEEIKEEIVKLSNLDYKCKSGLINKDVMLITYILELCS